jgi:hypothetical protein
MEAAEFRQAFRFENVPRGSPGNGNSTATGLSEGFMLIWPKAPRVAELLRKAIEWQALLESGRMNEVLSRKKIKESIYLWKRISRQLDRTGKIAEPSVAVTFWLMLPLSGQDWPSGHCWGPHHRRKSTSGTAKGSVQEITK